jgi:glucokinase
LTGEGEGGGDEIQGPSLYTLPAGREISGFKAESMNAIAGIDIGGTAVKIGLVSEEGSVLSKTSLPYDSRESFEDLVNSIGGRLASLAAAAKTGFRGIGISTPGYADPVTGALVDGANNVPALQGHSLTQSLSGRFGVPACIDNDGTCAATGELLFGAGRDFQNFVLITLGTGIGGGVMINRKPVTGKDGQPPEIGAICLDPGGPVNYSGVPGTFERLACASGFLDLYRRFGGRGDAGVTAEDIFRLAAQGDRAAESAIEQEGKYIAQTFGMMINLLNLEACLIGGGISAAGQPLLDAVRKHLPSFTWPNLYRKCRVLLAQLGNDAGLIGAAAMAVRRLGSK